MKKIGFGLLGLLGAVLGVVLLAAYNFKGFEPTSPPWSPKTQAAQGVEIAPRDACRANFPERQALFGDLHIHTSVSMDANSLGTRTTPSDAYKYARGEAIEVYTGDPQRGMRRAQLGRPLDFAAVTDHAEWMAEVSLCTTPGSASHETPGCRIYGGEEESLLAKLIGMEGFRARIGGLIGIRGRRRDVCGEDAEVCRAQLGAVWRVNQEAAERWYDRSDACAFTTFHAWEYSHSPYSTKVHRNIHPAKRNLAGATDIIPRDTAGDGSAPSTRRSLQ